MSKPIAIRIPDDLLADLKRLAAEDYRPLASMVVCLMREAMAVRIPRERVPDSVIDNYMKEGLGLLRR